MYGCVYGSKKRKGTDEMSSSGGPVGDSLLGHAMVHNTVLQQCILEEREVTDEMFVPCC
jgi:hypothetical protein